MTQSCEFLDQRTRHAASKGGITIGSGPHQSEHRSNEEGTKRSSNKATEGRHQLGEQKTQQKKKKTNKLQRKLQNIYIYTKYKNNTKKP